MRSSSVREPAASSAGPGTRRRSTSCAPRPAAEPALAAAVVALDLAQFVVDPTAAELLHPDHARYHEALPVAFADERTLLVAMVDPADALAAREIALLTGFAVQPIVAARDQLLALATRSATPPRAAGALRFSAKLTRSPS